MLHKENNGILHLFKTMQINSRLYIHINLDIQWRKIVPSMNGVGKTAQPYEKKIDISFTQYRQTNSKWIKDLNVRPKIMELLQESTVRLCALISSQELASG